MTEVVKLLASDFIETGSFRDKRGSRPEYMLTRLINGSVFKRFGCFGFFCEQGYIYDKNSLPYLLRRWQAKAHENATEALIHDRGLDGSEPLNVCNTMYREIQKTSGRKFVHRKGASFGIFVGAWRGHGKPTVENWELIQRTRRKGGLEWLLNHQADQDKWACDRLNLIRTSNGLPEVGLEVFAFSAAQMKEAA